MRETGSKERRELEGRLAKVKRLIEARNAYATDDPDALTTVDMAVAAMEDFVEWLETTSWQCCARCANASFSCCEGNTFGEPVWAGDFCKHFEEAPSDD